MPRLHFQITPLFLRSGFVLAIVVLAAFGILHGIGNVDSQSTTALDTTPIALAATTAEATPVDAAPTITPAATTAATATATAAVEFTAGQAVVVNADALNFRTDASINATINFTLANGAWATIVDGPTDSGDGYAWWLIDVNGTTGWVAGAYLIDATSDSAALPAGAIAMATSDGLNLRAEPSLSAAVTTQLANGDTATVVAGAQTADDYVWYQLDVNGVIGWAARNYLAYAPTNVSTAAAGDTALINTNALALRDSPSTSGAELATLAGGADVTIVSGPTNADNQDWYEVNAGSTTGWVAVAYLWVV